MDRLQRRGMTPEEFLAWEDRQDLRWEFDGAAPRAINGGTIAHATILGNVLGAFRDRLAGGRCTAYGPTIRVATTPGCYRYPDAVVTCTRQDAVAKVLARPVIVVEVLSDSTAAYDRTVKLAEYRAVPTIQRCILLEQSRAFATVLTRTDRGWDHALLGPDGVLAMPEAGVEIPVAAFYLGLEFEADPPEE